MTKINLARDGLDVVTGEAGFIGSHLVDRLLGGGFARWTISSLAALTI